MLAILRGTVSADIDIFNNLFSFFFFLASPALALAGHGLWPMDDNQLQQKVKKTKGKIIENVDMNKGHAT